MISASTAHIAACLRRILPPSISVAVLDIDELAMDSVPAELVLPGAAAKRQQQFAAGRLAARQAIEASGHAPAFPARGDDRQPLWPEGLVGSISHTDRYALAAAAGSDSIPSVGIDIEALREMGTGLRQKLLTENETSRLEQAGRYDDAHVLQLFSYKECVYKAVYPLFGRYIGFGEVEISATDDGLRAACTDPAHPAAGLVARLRGDALLDNDHIITGCWMK